MLSVVSPVSSLHARQGSVTGEIFECRSCFFPPWPPNLRLGGQGGSLSPLLVEWLCWQSCGSLCRFACRSRLRGRDAVSVDRLVSCFPLCGSCVSVGGLRTATVFPVFALVVLVGPVAVFSDR